MKIKRAISKVITVFFTLLIIISNNNNYRVYTNNINTSENSETTSNFYGGKNHGYVYLGGTPLGIKLKCSGLLVVALSDIEEGNGKVSSPAIDSDIRIGDIIKEINGIRLSKSQDITDILNSSRNSKISMVIERNDKLLSKETTAVCSKDGNYKLGIWVRESMAGVGTLTFYDPKKEIFAALGHAVTDSDTNDIFKISSGKIVESSISSVKRGERGNPGELRGIFIDENSPMGEVKRNSITGVYGIGSKELITSSNQKLIKLGSYKDIKEGPAKILTTIEGQEPKFYDIKIEKLLEQKSPSTKSMVIVVTDKYLLDKTGGIVQGMSGSPIIQNGKLIGAVTHVLVNKPDTGYGIYIDWMLQEINSVK